MKIKKFNELKNKLNESKDDLLPPFSGLSPYEMKNIHAAFKSICNICIEHEIELDGLVNTDTIIDKIKESIDNYIYAYEDDIIADIDKEFIFNYDNDTNYKTRDDFEAFEQNKIK